VSDETASQGLHDHDTGVKSTGLSEGLEVDKDPVCDNGASIHWLFNSVGTENTQNWDIPFVGRVEQDVRGITTPFVSESCELVTIPSWCELQVEVGGKFVVAILDTGAERSVIDISLLPKELMKANMDMRTVKLISAFGQQVIGKLANVPCKLISSGMMYQPCIISMAVADDMASRSAFLL